MTKTSITFFGRLCPKKGIPTCRSWLPILSRTLPQKVGGFDVRWLRVFRFLRLRVRRWKSRCQKEKNVWQINSCEWPNCLQLLFCRLGLVGNLLVYDVPGHFWPFFLLGIASSCECECIYSCYHIIFPDTCQCFLCHLWKIKVCLVRLWAVFRVTEVGWPVVSLSRVYIAQGANVTATFTRLRLISRLCKYFIIHFYFDRTVIYIRAFRYSSLAASMMIYCQIELSDEMRLPTKWNAPWNWLIFVVGN